MTDPGPAKQRLAAEREQTLNRLAELEREFAAIVTSASEGSAGGDDEHDPEGATVAFERQHVAALAGQAHDHLAAIDAALRKIDSGIYEICDICGGPIGEERLAARPASLICVRCARTRRLTLRGRTAAASVLSLWATGTRRFWPGGPQGH